MQQEPQTRELDRHGSSTEALPTPQRSVPMENGKQEVQPGFKLGRAWGKIPEDISQRNIFPRPYLNHQRLESQQLIQTLRREGSQNQG
ncbi:hypothetical protein O181_005002 [Austropuccinia psidii MF-1]|uniref:Uncharacterized protein n=1 Tax=Austropuccinia psidii MF-1 TaxID=1389203 RepID=A0A9Q3BHY2_9BASI|nr:hypothetical protein [Austropuccinia psidii MF-1]